MQTLLITGTSGFIGKHLLRNIKNFKVITDNNNFCTLNLPKIDFLIHQAACTDTTNYDNDYMIDINCHKAIELFKKAIENGCQKIVYASSAACYGDNETILSETTITKPINPYACSKVMLDEKAEKLANDSKIPIIGLRYSNVYGPGEESKGTSASMVSRSLWQMVKGNPKLFKWGNQRRDWVFVKDVVDANLNAILHGKSGIYNIGSGENKSFNEIIANWNSLLKTNRKIEYIDNPYENKYQASTLLDITKARKELKYNPQHDLLRGMKDYSPFSALNAL